MQSKSATHLFYITIKPATRKRVDLSESHLKINRYVSLYSQTSINKPKVPGHPETSDNDVAKHKETVTGTSNLLRNIRSIKVLMFDTEI